MDTFSWKKPSAFTANHLKKFFIPLISNSLELDRVLEDQFNKEQKVKKELVTKKNIKKESLNENNKDLLDKKNEIVKSAREII